MFIPAIQDSTILIRVVGRNGTTHVVKLASKEVLLRKENQSVPQRRLIIFPRIILVTNEPLKRALYVMPNPTIYAIIGKDIIKPPVGPMRH